MKALFLLATLKNEAPSNTEVLSEFLAVQLQKRQVSTEIVKLVNYNILPGTYQDMGEGDEWKLVLDKIKAADIIVFATPIWWSSHSSEMQKVIERLDKVHDEIMAGQGSLFDGKVGGIVITGDSDGAQHIIGCLSNFFNAIGLLLPPFATLSVMYDGHAKEAETNRDELWQKYEEQYLSTAEKMTQQLLKYLRSA